MTPPSPSTWIDLLQQRATDQPERTACWHHHVKTWRSMSWDMWQTRGEHLAAALQHANIHPGDRVALLSTGRLEWLQCALGVALAQAVLVPMNIGELRPRYHHILEATQPRVVIVDTPPRLATLLELRAQHPSIQRLIYIDARTPRQTPSPQGRTQWLLDDVIDWPPPEDVVSFDEFLERGAIEHTRSDARPLPPPKPEDVATIAFSSGTSGPLDGVRLTHRNLTAVAQALAERLACQADDAVLVGLPFGHILGLVFTLTTAMSHSCSVLPGSLERVGEALVERQPSIVVSLPSTFEALHTRALLNLQHRRLGRTLAQRRVLIASSASDKRTLAPIRWVRQLRNNIAQRVMRDHLQTMLGPPWRLAISVGGPLSSVRKDFFEQYDRPMAEGYGLTKATGITHLTTTTSPLNDPLPGVETMLDTQGEVLLRGPGLGFNEETRPGGWHPTGDVGHVDEDGVIRLLGRQRFAITLSEASQRLIYPLQIEQRLKRHPLIDHVIVFGDARPFLSALISLHPTMLELFAQQQRLPTSSIEELTQHRRVFEVIEAQVEMMNRQVTPAEQIRKFAILEQPLSRARGELTPMRQVRRAFTIRRYRALLESFYEAPF